MRRRISTTGRGSGMTDDDQRYLTAIHEAGHAIAGQALGFTVHEVTVQDGPGGGTCAADVERPHGTLDAIQREAAAREALRILRERWNDVQSLAIRLNARGGVDLGEKVRQARLRKEIARVEVSLAKRRPRVGARR